MMTVSLGKTLIQGSYKKCLHPQACPVKGEAYFTGAKRSSTLLPQQAETFAKPDNF